MQLQLGDDLRRKILLQKDGSGSDDSDGSSELSDISDGDSDDDDERDLQALAKLRSDLEMQPDDGPAVYKLAFMQRGLARQQKALAAEVEDMEAEILGKKPTDHGDEATASSGRRSFSGGRKGTTQTKTNILADLEVDWGEADGDAEDIVAASAVGNGGKRSTVVQVTAPIKVAAMPSGGGKTRKTSTTAAALLPIAHGEERVPGAEENPWLKQSQSGAGQTPDLVMTAFSRKSERRLAKLQRHRSTLLEAETAADRDAATARAAAGVTIDLHKAEEVGPPAKRRRADHADEQDEESDRGEDGFQLVGTGSDEQRALIKEAFAGDNIVEEEFRKEKTQLVDAETPKDEDITLPGWGNWGGEGLTSRKRVIKKAPITKPRKDNNLKHVIINERFVSAVLRRIRGQVASKEQCGLIVKGRMNQVEGMAGCVFKSAA